jgi:hypothetical protein
VLGAAAAGIPSPAAAARAPGAARFELAQLPDSITIPPPGGEEGEEDTTTVLPSTPGVKPAPGPAPFDTTGVNVPAPIDTTGAHVPAPAILEPGAAVPDTTRFGGPPRVPPPVPRSVESRADTTAAAPPERHGALHGIHPAALVIGLIAVHVLIVKLIAK